MTINMPRIRGGPEVADMEKTYRIKGVETTREPTDMNASLANEL